MSDYIARRYTLQLAARAVQDYADELGSDGVYDTIAELAQEDALELSADDLEALQEKVFVLLNDSVNVVIG